MPGRATTGLTLGAIVGMIAYSYVVQRGQSTRIRTRLTVTTVWMVAIVLWPLVWRSVVQREDVRSAFPLIGLLWPIVILIGDLVAMRQHTYDTALQSKRQFMTMDANAICSLTFAISAYIGAQNHKCCNRIFLWAILGCVAFIMPSPHTHVNALESIAYEAMQKGVLAYATGFLITGVLLVNGQSNGASSGTMNPAMSEASSSRSSSSSSDGAPKRSMPASSSSSPDWARLRDDPLREVAARLREAADLLQSTLVRGAAA